jgi:hypothetical protein
MHRAFAACKINVIYSPTYRNLVTKHARVLASKASTWGGRRPTKDEFERLVNACVAEWTRALRQMLKHWDKPPSTTGN